MNQVVAFAEGIFAYILLFFALQIVIFHLTRVKQLILVFTLIAFFSAAVIWIPFFYLTSELFSDPVTRALLACAGAYGSLGFSGTYIILGPISADRSLSAHICIHMLRANGHMSQKELMGKYTQYMIFQKRFDEYVEVGVMTREADELYLTGKGRRIAYTFLTFLKALKMKENF
jgi:hypothetical protein